MSFALFTAVLAQSGGHTKIAGDFISATCFDINAAGIIYICDSETNEIFKISSQGKVLKTIGGYGWAKEAFDDPIDIFANMLNVYVSDYNNHRIQIFDKDLNFLSVFTTKDIDDRNMAFAYPKGCAVSNQGDLFVLDGDNQRIIKYDLTGNFLLEIGNTDAGTFALSNPNNIAVSNSTKLFVSDSDVIKVFDIFGTGLTTFNPGLSKPRVRVFESILTVSGSSEIKFMNLQNQSGGFLEFIPDLSDESIKDAIVTDKYIYILTAENLYKFNR